MSTWPKHLRAGYVELALKSLPEETDESLARIQGARVAVALHSYLHEAGRKSLAPRAESVIADRMLNAPTLGLRIVSFRTFTSISETPAALQQVKDLLTGKLAVPGLTLKRLDRWNLIGHLIAMGDPQAESILADEKARDHSGEGSEVRLRRRGRNSVSREQSPLLRSVSSFADDPGRLDHAKPAPVQFLEPDQR